MYYEVYVTPMKIFKRGGNSNDVRPVGDPLLHELGSPVPT